MLLGEEIKAQHNFHTQLRRKILKSKELKCLTLVKGIQGERAMWKKNQKGYRTFLKFASIQHEIPGAQEKYDHSTVN